MIPQEIVDKFRELDFLLDQIYGKIEKCHQIIFAQEIGLLTPGIEQYRADYLKKLHRHRKIVEHQQMELIDGIDIKDIMQVLQE